MKERTYRIIGWIALIPLAVAIIIVEAQKLPCFAASKDAGEEIVDLGSETPEKADFEGGAMPCEDPEAFRRWLSEQETGEEARPDDVRAADEVVGAETESEPVATEAAAKVESSMPALYRIAGETIDEGLQVRLYQHLQDAGIEYWYEGALAQMFQESHCLQYAENRNGLDKGIYQYRITYWTEPDGIFDIDAQMRKYAAEMAARFGAGLTVDQAISRHKTSDYCTDIDWLYVQHVKQWLGQMEVVK